MIKIRRGQAEDLEWMVGELKLFSDFFNSKKPLFSNPERVRDGMTTMVKEHLVLVADKEGVGPVGFIAGLLVPHIFNPDIRCLTETFWWVQKEHRKGRAGFMLLQAFIEFGKKYVDWILCSIEENSPVNPTVLLDRGFKLRERSFVMEVN